MTSAHRAASPRKSKARIHGVCFGCVSAVRMNLIQGLDIAAQVGVQLGGCSMWPEGESAFNLHGVLGRQLSWGQAYAHSTVFNKL